MVRVNLVLWLAMVGAMFAPVPDGAAKWTAVAGLLIAAIWEHSAVRGFFRPRKGNTPPASSAR